MSIDNLPDNFSGIEGQEENRYIFHIQGEFEEYGEGLSEEEAVEELMGRTVRELLEDGTVFID